MDDRQFRNAMGKFATGVTVIATEVEGEGIHGMTANAFMSVSLDPKLVVISIGEKVKILNKIKDSQTCGRRSYVMYWKSHRYSSRRH